MKKLIILFTTSLLFFSCSETQKPQNICKESAFINETEICLPDMKNLTNIYNDKTSNIYLEFSHLMAMLSSQQNEILGFYKEDANFDSDFNYSAIYVNETVKMDINYSNYLKAANTMGLYLDKIDNFQDDIEKYGQNYFTDNISRDVPVVIEKYSINDDITTYLLINKLIEDGEEYVTLTSLNLIYIRKKMVLLNYVIEYENSNSIDILKQKNDYITMRFLNENN